MPKSITGNTPAPTPRHHDVPQAEPILNTVRQHEGLYSLNDLHRLSGGKSKHSPSLFFQNQQAKDLLAEMEREYQDLGNPMPYIVRVIGKGKEQGTYTCEEIACIYATWISTSFHLVVIRAFLRLSTYTQRVNVQSKNINTLEHHVSGCGRDLSVHGKQTLPRMRNELAVLLAEQQLKLELGE